MTAKHNKFYEAGGTLSADAPSYVWRDADEELFSALENGNFCYVLTSRQMGKSSLMKRTSRRLREKGLDVAELDLSSIGKDLTPDQWYYTLLKHLCRALGVADTERAQFWEANKGLGAANRWLEALAHLIVPYVETQLTIFVDELDIVQGFAFSADDFFAGIRACYNRRADDQSWHRINFCLLGVASPADLIRDARMTPFNIGQRIALHDFTISEAATLAGRLGPDASINSKLYARIFRWTNGHPYLTQRLCMETSARRVKKARQIDKLCNEMFFVSREDKDPNLELVGSCLAPKPTDGIDSEKYEESLAGRLDLYRRILNKDPVRNQETQPYVNDLHLTGAVRDKGGYLRVRNLIYERAFDRKWLKERMPGAERRRQQAARRRGFWRATAWASMVIAVLAAMTVFALVKNREAERQRNVANRQAELTRHATTSALQSAEEARRKTVEAEAQADLARRERQNADQRKQEADVSAAEARNQGRIARENAGELNEQRRRNGHLVYEAGIEKVGSLWKSMGAAHTRIIDEPRVSRIGKSLHQVQVEEERVKSKLVDFEFNYYQRYVKNKMPLTLKGHNDEVMAVAWSPDGNQLASVSLNIYGRVYEDNRVKIWDAKTGAVQATLKGHKERVWSVSWSPDGTRVATASSDKTVRVWDVSSQEAVLIFEHDGEDFDSVVWSPDGKYIAAGEGWSGRHSICVWTLESGELQTLSGHTDAVYSLAWSPDGKSLASGSWDNTVRIWDFPAGTYRPLVGHGDRVYGVAWSPDGKEIASASFDGTIKVWDFATGRERPFMKESDRKEDLDKVVYAVAWSPDGKTIASGHYDGAVNLWDAATGDKVLINRGHTDNVRSVAFSNDGKRLASASHDETVKVWNVDRESESRLYAFPTNKVINIDWSADRKRLALAGSNGVVQLWDVERSTLSGTINVPADRVKIVAWSPDGNRLVTVSQRDSKESESYEDPVETLEIWDSHSGVKLFELREKEMRDMTMISTVVWSPAGKRLALLAGGNVLLSEIPATGNYLPSFREIKEVNKPLNDAHILAWSPKGDKLAVAYRSNKLKRALRIEEENKGDQQTEERVRVLSVDDNKVLLDLPTDVSPVNAVAWSSDEERFVTGNEEGRLYLWDLKKQNQRDLFLGHISGVTALSWSPNSKRLASAGEDQTVRVWDTETGTELLNFREPACVVSVAWLSNGQQLAAVRTDGRITVWDGRSAENRVWYGIEDSHSPSRPLLPRGKLAGLRQTPVRWQ